MFCLNTFLRFYFDTNQLYFDSLFGHRQAKNKIEMIEKYNVINTLNKRERELLKLDVT